MKERLDQILLNNKMVENRNKARSLIMDGKVIVNNEKVMKPGTLFDSSKINITIKNIESEFVSRAGKKLDSAIKKWNIDLSEKVCLDIGSSTGGFTDCCLKYGASFIYAVDVGTNQLDWKLRNNDKVQSIENTNFRYVDKSLFKKNISFFCCDVSFISVKNILEPLSNIVSQNVEGIILIKPQFECDKENIKNGKINSKEYHLKAIKRVNEYAINNKFTIKDIHWSPILGNKKKNIEYLCYLTKNDNVNNYREINFEKIVEECWLFFYGKQITK
ncbi:rRNA methyltransferase [Spiroplasma litorale]|uniref:rRNA methyltransferase n=1 Tax=Spiroplasma litorale TaxID=216942 RepID=A0A0K1W203_9MOLU|nr:TlyA family RNA methyltransferase [Spiroplasma litorale]AKX34132.1 rRNA methyltransferase [Spiroplasma litorale]